MGGKTMRKGILVSSVVLILFMTGCGQVTKTVAATSNVSSSEIGTNRPLTAEEIALNKFTLAAQDLARSMIAPATGNPVSNSFSGISIQSLGSGSNVQTKLFSRQVGNNTETVEVKSLYCYQGVELSEYIENKTTIDYVERSMEIDCAAYSYNYPEDITYNAKGIPTITQKPGYSARMRHKQQNLDAVITDRTITYRDLANGGNATGTMTLTSDSLQGVLTITITNGSFYANGNLKINGKIAAYMEIKNGIATIQYLFGPSDNFYYNNNKLPPATNGDTVIYLVKDEEYGDIIIPNNNNKITVIGETGAIVTGNISYNPSKNTIKVTGVIFKVSAGKTAITIPNSNQGNTITIDNCTFLQVDNGLPNPGLLAVDVPNGNGNTITISNCTFIGQSLKNAVGLYVKNGGNMKTTNLTIKDCSFANLNYGIYVNGHSKNNQVSDSGLNMTNVNYRINPVQ